VLFCRPFEVPGGNVRSAAAAVFARIGDEISKCISHMVGSLHLDGMTEVFAFGDGTQDESFGAYLVERFNLQVRIPSPFESLPAGALSEEMRPQAEQASQYATAMGLALQTTGGAIHG
jgi:Tfp pilus assembly PilM family ATPase